MARKRTLIIGILLTLILVIAGVFVYNRFIQEQSNTVNVAIIDSGVDTEGHPQIKKDISWKYNAITGEENTAQDNYGHGTHIAGIICKANNHFHFELNLYIIKAFDEKGKAEVSWVLNGIQVAMRGPDGTKNTNDDADIISMSFGVSEDIPEVKSMVESVADQEIIMVGAAGNEGDNDTQTNEIQYPARYDEVISVGAYNDADKSIPDFSAEGAQIDVVAPGVNIQSAWKDGLQAIVNGTSQSTAFISGVASVFLSKNTSLQVGEFNTTGTGSLRSKLYEKAEDVALQGWDKYSGWGAVLEPVEEYMNYQMGILHSCCTSQNVPQQSLTILY